MCDYMGACGGQMSTSEGISQELFTLFRQDQSLGLGTCSLGLSSWPVISRTVPYWCWYYKHVSPHPAFMWLLELWTSQLCSIPTELSPQPQDFKRVNLLDFVVIFQLQWINMTEITMTQKVSHLCLRDAWNSMTQRLEYYEDMTHMIIISLYVNQKKEGN